MSLVLAVTTQQKVGIAVVVVMGLGWLVYILSSTRRTAEPGSEVELAPNRRPYLDDDAMEGPRLDRALGWSMALLAIVAIGLPAYWVREPSRQKGAIVGYGQRAVARGAGLFSPAPPPSDPGSRKPHFACSGCHGPKGEGGSTQYSLPNTNPPVQVNWQVPALNTVTLRFRDDEIITIITYGRQNTPMPPWGVKGGGPMNDQQISDLVAYLHSISIGRDKAIAEAAPLGTDGKALFDSYCARCHTQGFSFGQPGIAGGGAFGPDLTGGRVVRQFPDIAMQIDWISNTADFGKPYGVRGVSHGIMPHFSDMLTPDQIKAIAEYERAL